MRRIVITLSFAAWFDYIGLGWSTPTQATIEKVTSSDLRAKATLDSSGRCYSRSNRANQSKTSGTCNSPSLKPQKTNKS